MRILMTCIVGEYPLKDRGRAGENFTELSIQNIVQLKL